MELTKLMTRRKRLTWCVVKVTPSGSAIFLRKEVFRRMEYCKEVRTLLQVLAWGDDHLGEECPRGRECNINVCKDRHNRLLRGDQTKGTRGVFVQ